MYIRITYFTMNNLTIDTNSEIDDTYTNKNTKKYTYSIEQHTTKSLTNLDILNNNSNIFGKGILNILCYHVTQNSKYPFIQFLLEKKPFLTTLIPEKLELPMVTISNADSDMNYDVTIIEKIKGLLLAIGCDGSKLTCDAFKGLISDYNERIYALVDISDVDIFRIAFTRNTPIWFGLPTEIMNVRSICNIPIDESVSELFLHMPELGVLRKLDVENVFPVGNAFPLPDAIYSGSHLRQTEFRSIFGMSKDSVYSSCGEYYYYFRLFEDAVKEGGWLREGGHKTIDLNDMSLTHSVSGKKLVDNEYGRYIQGGINRYAFFTGNYTIHTESSNMFSLTDAEVSAKLEKNTSIVIIYMEDNLDNMFPDILVKEYELAFPISYHMLNKSILGEKYEIDNQDKYMIA